MSQLIPTAGQIRSGDQIGAGHLDLLQDVPMRELRGSVRDELTCFPPYQGGPHFDHEMKEVRRMSDHNTSNLLTLNDVADALAVSNLTARRIIRRGEIASFKAGGQYRIRAEDLSAYIRQAVKVATRKQRATRTAIPA